ncbi:MAG: hypothetical protein AAF968_01030, partial [Pseudomonadota bacterium]
AAQTLDVLEAQRRETLVADGPARETAQGMGDGEKMLIAALGPNGARLVFPGTDGDRNPGKATAPHSRKVPRQLKVEICENVPRDHMRDNARAIVHDVSILNVHERNALYARLNHCIEKTKVTHQGTTLATVECCVTLRYQSVNAK